MNPIETAIARTKQQVDDALKVRWQVFGAELGLLDQAQPVVQREVDCFDTLDSTVHFVAYADGTPVATARLLLPNIDVARMNGRRVGIDLEFKFDLEGLEGPGIVLAETTRLCVLRSHRGSQALRGLYAAMYRESLKRGVSHWVASANTETDSMQDACIAYRVADKLGFTSPQWRVEPCKPAAPPAHPRRPLYTEEQRARAANGDIEGLRLPGTLSRFARRMGARFTGFPIYDAHFRMCSTPLIVPLSSLGWLEGDDVA